MTPVLTISSNSIASVHVLATSFNRLLDILFDPEDEGDMFL
jgi:hypothetical protein